MKYDIKEAHKNKLNLEKDIYPDIVEYLTGRNKADPLQGLPSIEKEFDNQEWLFAIENEPKLGESDLNDPWVKLIYEFQGYPFYETTDIVMSLYFAREGAKQFLRGDEGPNVW